MGHGATYVFVIMQDGLVVSFGAGDGYGLWFLATARRSASSVIDTLHISDYLIRKTPPQPQVPEVTMAIAPRSITVPWF